MGRGIVYKCSDSRYCPCSGYLGDADLWEKFESGAWEPFCWDQEDGTEWVVANDDNVLTLEPVPVDKLPDTVEYEQSCSGISIRSKQSASQ